MAPWSMSDRPPEIEPSPAQRWFRLAEEDLIAARVLLRDGSAALRIAGFLAQQAAEKALNAGLFAANSAVPKIHGLSQLHASYLPDRAPDIDPEDLEILDPWVIDGTLRSRPSRSRHVRGGGASGRCSASHRPGPPPGALTLRVPLRTSAVAATTSMRTSGSPRNDPTPAYGSSWAQASHMRRVRAAAA